VVLRNTTLRDNPEHLDMNLHRREDLKTRIRNYFILVRIMQYGVLNKSVFKETII